MQITKNNHHARNNNPCPRLYVVLTVHFLIRSSQFTQTVRNILSSSVVCVAYLGLALIKIILVTSPKRKQFVQVNMQVSKQSALSSIV